MARGGLHHRVLARDVVGRDAAGRSARARRGSRRGTAAPASPSARRRPPRRRARTRAAPRARSRDPSGSRAGRRTRASTRPPRGTARRRPRRTSRSRRGSASPEARSRIAATRPSIMSLGQTASAPASTWLTAVRAISSSDASLSTSSPRSTPQWPCAVYSQRQTSVKSRSSGNRGRSERRARCTIPSSSHAPEPSSSFDSGIPNRITAPTPSRTSSSTSRSRSATEKRAERGQRVVRLRVRPDEQRLDELLEVERVSRTSARRPSVRRRRRRRVTREAHAGKPTHAQPRGNGEDGGEAEQPARLAREHAPRARRRRAPSRRTGPRGRTGTRRSPSRPRARPPAGRGRRRRPAARRAARRATPSARRARARRRGRRARRARRPRRRGRARRAAAAPTARRPSTFPTVDRDPEDDRQRRARARARRRPRARPSRRRSRPAPARPRTSRPITFSSRSEATAPAASRSARNEIVSAIPYACTCAESSQLRPCVGGLLEHDRVRGRLERRARVGEREPRLSDEVLRARRRAARCGICPSTRCAPSRPSRSNCVAEEACPCRRAGSGRRSRGSASM